MKTIHIIVKGRVQGVSFRAATRRAASKLGVNGQVQNKPDGSVEIVAQANQEQLDQLVQWCHKGSLMAKVSEVKVSSLDDEALFYNFEVV